MAIVCDSPEGLSRLVSRLDEITQAWHLDISQGKTKILSIDKNNTQPKPSITLRDVKIKQVDSFKYLGRIFSSTPSIASEISARVQKASHSFWRFKTVLYRRSEISLKTKIRIFKMTVLPTLLYGSESWPITASQLRRLQSFVMRCLRYILGIRFATHGNVPNKTIRRRCKVLSIADLLRTNRLRWLGHLARMDKCRLPVKALFSRLSGSRPEGGQLSSWRKLVINDLVVIHQTNTWFDLTRDRNEWRRIIHCRPQSLLSCRSRSLRSSTRVQRKDRLDY
jgi:hypothetical protein